MSPVSIRKLRLVLLAGLLLLPAALAPAGFPLPKFGSSDPEHDRLLNDLFRRHARIVKGHDSLRLEGYPVPAGGTVSLWRDWEVDMLLWHDYSATNYPEEDRPGFLKVMTTETPLDKFGYYFTALNHPTPPGTAPGTHFGMGWPFPTYVNSVGLSAGFEWQTSTSTLDWQLEDAETADLENGKWSLRATGPHPAIVSPYINAHWFHAPFVHLDVQYQKIDPAFDDEERAFRLYWQTDVEPWFSEERSVDSRRFPVIPRDTLSTATLRRFWLPMYLHPEWKGQTIRRLRFEPVSPAQGRGERELEWSMNYLRLDYDSRHSVNNPIFIRFVARKFFWDGDAEFLKSQLPRMRKAMQFLLSHLQGDALNLIDNSWFVGHDGIGWTENREQRIGHGIGSNYFDIVCMGPRDLSTNIYFYQALEALAKIEEWVEAHPKLDSPRPSVIGPDGQSEIPYRETAESLRARLEPVRQAVHREFWNPETGRYAGWRNVCGELKDYGYTQFNLEAILAGIADAQATRSILEWLDGARTVEGDDSTGEDIYTWRFATRFTTRRNALDYMWAWSGFNAPFGGQVQDGGAVLFTTYFDVRARLAAGDRQGAWTVWRRMIDHHAEVIEAGGRGPDFYRVYYENHPGTLQGGPTPGGLGLDSEFAESFLTPCAWALGWIGIDAPEPELFRVAPQLPPGLETVRLENAVYRGNRIDITHGPGMIDLSGSNIEQPEAGTLELVFPAPVPPGARVLRNGQPDPGELSREGDRLVLRTRLGPDRFEVAAP